MPADWLAASVPITWGTYPANGASSPAIAAMQSGAPLAITLDGSNRLATMTNGTTGRVASITYADATHLTISDNLTPQAIGTLVLDAGGRLVSYSGNF